MPKRSLHLENGGKGDPRKIEQLNKAIEAMLSRTDGKAGKVEAGIEPLLRIAAALRDLPRADFKARLKAQLRSESEEKRTERKNMTTVAEPVTAVRTTATPRLTFKDAAKAIEFYKQALGAKELMRFDTGEGIPHAEIMVGDSTILLSEEWPEGGRLSAETLGSSPLQMSLAVADVDAFAKRAVAAGMKSLGPIRDQFYGRREGSFIDPFGYTWNISTVTEEMSVDEMHRRMKGLTAGPESGHLPQGGSPEAKAKVNPIPRGFRTVTPYLIAKDGPALLEFAKQAFAGEETFRTVGSAGAFASVSVRRAQALLGCVEA